MWFKSHFATENTANKFLGRSPGDETSEWEPNWWKLGRGLECTYVIQGAREADVKSARVDTWVSGPGRAGCPTLPVLSAAWRWGRRWWWGDGCLRSFGKEEAEPVLGYLSVPAPLPKIECSLPPWGPCAGGRDLDSRVSGCLTGSGVPHKRMRRWEIKGSHKIWCQEAPGTPTGDLEQPLPLSRSHFLHLYDEG